MSSCLKFFIKAVSGERVETALTIPEEHRSAIAGTVRAVDGTPLSGALLLLYDTDPQQILQQAFSDEDGAFQFGPLEPDRLYCIRVSYANTPARALEITI